MTLYLALALDQATIFYFLHCHQIASNKSAITLVERQLIESPTQTAL